MSSPISPIVSGLVNAFNLAGHFKDQQRQNEYLSLAKQRETDNQQREAYRQQMEGADLQMRLNAMGARPATASDDLEAQTGTKIDFSGVAPGGQLFSTAPSDIGSRFLKAGGQKYVLPSREDTETMADKASARATKREVAKTTAVEGARGEAKIKGKKAEIDQLGQQLSPEYTKLLTGQDNVPLKFLPEHADDVMRAVGTALANKYKQEDGVQHAIPMYGTKGSGVAVVYKSGKTTWNPIEDIGGKAFAPQRPESATEKRRGATDELNKQLDGIAGDLLTGANGDIAAAKAAALKRAQTDADVKSNLPSIIKRLGTAPKAPKTDASIEAQFNDLLGNGQGTAAKQKAASKGTVTGDQIRAYAKARSVSYAEAERRAKADGYEVK